MSEEKKTKELTTTPQEEQAMVAKLREMSGESGGGVDVHFVNFNGKEGKFYEPTKEKDEKGKVIKKSLGKTLEGIIVKSRNRVKVLNKDKEKCFQSAEFDSYTENLVVYDGNKKKVAEGTYQTIKLALEIKMEKVLYLKVKDTDQITKLSVKGASLVNFFDYLNSFDRTKNESATRQYTTFGGVSDENDFGVFYKMTFERGDSIELVEALELVEGLDKALNAIKTKNNTEEVTPESNFPEDEEGENDIKVEDIPF